MQHIILNKTTGEIVHINGSRKDLSDKEAYFNYDPKKHIHARGPKPLPEFWKNEAGVIREKTLTEKVDDGDVILAEGFTLEDNKIRPMTDAERLTAGLISQAEYDEIKWTEIRAKRNGLLRESDWTQIEDCTVDKQTWKDYRKLLRDLPATYTDWNNVVWPTEPI